MSETSLNQAPEYLFELLPRYRHMLTLATISLLLAGLLPPAIVFGQALQGQIDRLGVVLLIAGFPFLVLCLWLTHQSFLLRKPNLLRLNADGIQWQTGFFSLQASWDDVTGFGPVQTGQGKLAGLRTRKPMKLIPGQQHGILAHELHGIPTLFYGDYQQGPLKVAIEHFAPALYLKQTS
ncbi:MAG: hypothetical protein CVV27_07665 [Candidatus Melainabacteria bacterium HGW-Melainabacteria-1]|nr:MAG: hypothetical protein CVV27_07665 [Candidatus Melainabacteria bacterium HGW-Melainabacteria-1]